MLYLLMFHFIYIIFGSFNTCTLDKAHLHWFYEYKPKVSNFPGSPITS